jgi:hypothetical protein
MNRRTFLASGLAGAASLGIASSLKAQEVAARQSSGRRSFKLKYAPHFGMFKHHAGEDPVDQLKFAADQGFTAWEDNGMKGRSVEEQERIAQAMADLGMTMGVFVANTIGWTDPTLTTGQPEHLERFIADCRDSVDVARRMNAKWHGRAPARNGIPDGTRGRSTAPRRGDLRTTRTGHGARGAQLP